MKCKDCQHYVKADKKYGYCKRKYLLTTMDNLKMRRENVSACKKYFQRKEEECVKDFDEENEDCKNCEHYKICYHATYGKPY